MGEPLFQLFDHCYLAVRYAKAQAFRVALGCAAALGYYYCEFTSGCQRCFHTSIEECRLEPATTVVDESACPAHREDLVFRNHQADGARNRLAVDCGYKCAGVLHLVEGDDESAKSFGRAVRTESVLDNFAGRFGFFDGAGADLASCWLRGKFLRRIEWAEQHVIEFGDRVAALFEHLEDGRIVQGAEVHLRWGLVSTIELLDPI